MKSNSSKVEKSFINEYLYRRLLFLIPDSVECGEVAEELTNDVFEDVLETSDNQNWNSGDIDISIARILRKRILKEN